MNMVESLEQLSSNSAKKKKHKKQQFNDEWWMLVTERQRNRLTPQQVWCSPQCIMCLFSRMRTTQKKLFGNDAGNCDIGDCLGAYKLAENLTHSVCGRNPMMWPFKWNLFSSTFAWYHLLLFFFFLVFNILQNYILDFSWILIFGTIGYDKRHKLLRSDFLQMNKLEVDKIIIH